MGSEQHEHLVSDSRGITPGGIASLQLASACRWVGEERPAWPVKVSMQPASGLQLKDASALQIKPWTPDRRLKPPIVICQQLDKLSTSRVVSCPSSSMARSVRRWQPFRLSSLRCRAAFSRCSPGPATNFHLEAWRQHAAGAVPGLQHS